MLNFGSLDEFSGLTPRSWICVGPAFSREDVKALLLSKGIAFTGDAVQTFQGLCQKLAGVEASSVLASPGRQEALRFVLSMTELKGQFPELKRLKRQGTFLRRLDHAIQAGRMAFSHWEEAGVYGERLAQKFGANALREEVEGVAKVYEAWLKGKNLWDPPLLIRQATVALSEGKHCELPAKIYLLHGQTEESLERSFWDALSRVTEVIRVRAGRQDAPPKLSWERWHTLDDAAERLSAMLAEEARKQGHLSESVALIPESASSRRTLKRALEQRGVLLSDPRDPTRIRWDEAIKWAMLPLEVVARGFERPRVIAFLASFSKISPPARSEVTREIHERGVRGGIESYSGGKLVLFHAELSKLAARLGGKKTALELARAHLDYLEAHLTEDRVWVAGFFERLWKDLVVDLGRVDLGERRAAPLYWLERVQSRIAEAQAPVERLKPLGGLDSYRLHQFPSRAYQRAYVFGVPAAWLSGEGVGDYWYSEREREVLSTEFAVRSGQQVRAERLEALQSWLGSAKEVVFLDALYDPDGRERESIQPVLRAVLDTICEEVPESPTEGGSHPRWSKSYGALRPVPPQRAELPGLSPQAGSAPVISASALENYSRCGFLALARTRWKLDDLQEPDTDLWPHVKGILLHEAVRFLVESRDDQGNFSKSIEEAIDEAWSKNPPRGLLKGAKIEGYVKRKLGVLLRVFVEQERKYVARSGTRALVLENIELSADYGSFSIRGNPDRIDEHPDGLWIIDYKTSSSAPNGSTMLENGYRLQLPFYALAAQKKLGKAALGFQFVQLDRKGTRTNGVYFKSHNGKEPGKLTDTTARSKSLLTLAREEVWSRFDEEIRALGASYVSGVFEARPRITPRSKECDSCQVADFCGVRRIIEDAQDGEGSE